MNLGSMLAGLFESLQSNKSSNKRARNSKREDMARRFQERMEARSREMDLNARMEEFRSKEERRKVDARSNLLRERFGNRNEDFTNRYGSAVRRFRSSRPPIPRGRMQNIFGMQIRPEQI